MLTGQAYLDSLADGRKIYRDGKIVTEVAVDPFFRDAAEEVAENYDRFYSAEADATNPCLRPPRSVRAMREQVPLLEAIDQPLAATYQALNGLLIAASRLDETTEVFALRMRAYAEEAMRRDIRIVNCITDAKGDRSKPPSQQHDPDAYLRVVDRTEEGIVIRGAKMHVSGAPLAHELLVMPTKAMKPGEEDYAVACAVPVHSPGVHLTAAGYFPVGRDRRDYPASSNSHSISESMCIFDDVFVARDRVFLDGHTAHAATLVHALGLWERLSGVSFLVTQADQMVGLAQLVAEANGTAKIAHIREKIDEMIIHATLLRAGLEAAITNAHPTEDGHLYPDDMFTNVTKYLGATQHTRIIRDLHDIAGGAVVTAPSSADFDTPVLGPMVEKYMSTALEVSGSYRTRLFHTIRDATADAYGGWWSVAHLHGGGGLFAQRLVTRKHYDMNNAKALARRLAGLDQ